MGSRRGETVFPGTDEEAVILYRSLKEAGLRDEEEFVLLRYLDLDIPEHLERFSFMEDRHYDRAIRAVLDRLPASAKGDLVERG